MDELTATSLTQSHAACGSARNPGSTATPTLRWTWTTERQSFLVTAEPVPAAMCAAAFDRSEENHCTLTSTNVAVGASVQSLR